MLTPLPVVGYMVENKELSRSVILNTMKKVLEMPEKDILLDVEVHFRHSNFFTTNVISKMTLVKGPDEGKRRLKDKKKEEQLRTRDSTIEIEKSTEGMMKKTGEYVKKSKENKMREDKEKKDNEILMQTVVSEPEVTSILKNKISTKKQNEETIAGSIDIKPRLSGKKDVVLTVRTLKK